MRHETIIDGINVIVTRGSRGYDIDKADGGIMAMNTKLVSFGAGRASLQVGNRSYKISDDDAAAIASLTKTPAIAEHVAAPVDAVKVSRKHTEPCPKCGTYCSGDCHHN